MWGYSGSHFVTRVSRISVHPHGVIPCNPTSHFWKVFSNLARWNVLLGGSTHVSRNIHPKNEHVLQEGDDPLWLARLFFWVVQLAQCSCIFPMGRFFLQTVSCGLTGWFFLQRSLPRAEVTSKRCLVDEILVDDVSFWYLEVHRTSDCNS